MEYYVTVQQFSKKPRVQLSEIIHWSSAHLFSRSHIDLPHRRTCSVRSFCRWRRWRMGLRCRGRWWFRSCLPCIRNGRGRWSCPVRGRYGTWHGPDRGWSRSRSPRSSTEVQSSHRGSRTWQIHNWVCCIINVRLCCYWKSWSILEST